MQSITHYIVHVDGAFADSFQTENGTKIYLDKRFSAVKSANRIGTIVNVPANANTAIKKGFQIMFDPSILLRPIYSIGGEQDSPYLVDKPKSWYKIQPSLIVLYREDENSEWKGFEQSLMVELIKDNFKEVQSSLIYIPETKTETFKKGIAKVLYTNDILSKDENIQIGDEVYYKPTAGMLFEIEGKKMYWLRNRELHGKVIKN